MSRPRATKVLATAITATAVGAALAVAPTATSAPLVSTPPVARPQVSQPLVSGLAGPLQLDVGSWGVVVGESMAGKLTLLRRGGGTQTLAMAEGKEIAGVASRGRTLAYTVTRYAGAQAPVASSLWVRWPGGRTHKLADLRSFEERRNPDADQRYGLLDLSDDCAAQVDALDIPGVSGRPTPGIVDSHAYAVAKGPRKGWYVADAGGNDILYVSRAGRVRVVYVAKPQVTTVTASAAEANGLPDCTVGARFAFEGVPTDVEVTKRGKLVISLLPGGPEDPSLGARGSVVKVNPRTGNDWTAAGGLLSATNVAVGTRGRIYVTELFGNRVSVVRHGRVRPLVELPLPAAVEYARGDLFVTTHALPASETEPPNGQVVRVKVG